MREGKKKKKRTLIFSSLGVKSYGPIPQYDLNLGSIHMDQLKLEPIRHVVIFLSVVFGKIKHSGSLMLRSPTRSAKATSLDHLILCYAHLKLRRRPNTRRCLSFSANISRPSFAHQMESLPMKQLHW